jgi:uncharacterized membrane protein
VTTRALDILSRPDRFLLAAGLLFGLAFVFVTPPFQVPDEPGHFFRAWRVGEGRLDLLPEPGRGVVEIPVSLRDVTADLIADLPFHAERKIAPEKILGAFQVPLEPERRAPVWVGNSMVYPFVPYLPQAVGMALGRGLEAPPLALLYLARLTNLLAGTLMLFFAVRRLPGYRWLAVMIALTPMALAQRGSASADVTSMGAAFLLTACAAGMAWSERPARRRDLVLMTACSIVLCAAKAAYLPLAFLVLLIPAGRFPGGKRWPFLLLHGALSFAAAAYGVATARAVGIIRFDVAAIDPARQVEHALTHPLSFLQVVATDYVVHAPRYLAQFVGQLGWLDTKLPTAFLFIYLCVLLALVLADSHPRLEVRPWQRWIAAAVTVSTLLLISASQYAAWTPFGASYVEGLQGRYFIPLAPAAVWALHSRGLAERLRLRNPGVPLAAFSVVSFGITIWALVERYYGA